MWLLKIAAQEYTVFFVLTRKMVPRMRAAYLGIGLSQTTLLWPSKRRARWKSFADEGCQKKGELLHHVSSAHYSPSRYQKDPSCFPKISHRNFQDLTEPLSSFSGMLPDGVWIWTGAGMPLGELVPSKAMWVWMKRKESSTFIWSSIVCLLDWRRRDSRIRKQRTT